VGGDAGVSPAALTDGPTLTALEEAALGIAGSRAEVVRSAAERRAEQLLADARTEADAIVAGRRAGAARLADLQERERIAQARSEARATVLRAQSEVLDEAAAAARTAVRAVVGEPRFERLLERLAADARERLSVAGEVEIVAAPGGGLIARAGSLEIDYSVDAQVDRALMSAAGGLERLWR
jgi:vacuolar-type H+-ATPase subunit E/Vma4